jgi:hypothetical protein
MKKIFIISMGLLVLSLHLVAQTYSWQQVGADFTGKTSYEYYGQSVSINADGSVVAIGADLFTAPGLTNAGRVQVYRNNSGTWQQLGNDIIGEASNDQSGFSVALNANGTIVAIGAEYNDGNNAGSNCGHARVYQLVNDSWIQLGQDIDGEVADDRSGNQVSISADGFIVAVNAQWNDNYLDNSGEVRIYKYSGNSWTKIGNSIQGEATNDFIGNIDLNDDGTVVAIGTQYNGQGKGSVRVFKNMGDSWTQMGEKLVGEASVDWFGNSVSLNSEGNILAVGAPNNDPNDLASAGHTRVFNYSESTWTQIGMDIDGKVESEYSGKAVSLNASGTMLAVSSTTYDFGRGVVRIFENKNNAWVQVANDIYGKESTDDNFGWTCSLNAVGNWIAIGTPYNDNNSNNAGYVQVYEKQDITSIQNPKESNFSFFPNPVRNNLNISNLTINYSISIFDISGKKIIEKQADQNSVVIDFSDFEEGIYFINIHSETESFTQKIVKY